ncbi:substrate-binding domain-containing protein [Amycolatopsis sp. NPDC059021]|uniref:substrate-binding domain-containing protein n=1 Tax=Amycolatopsis sp. NPDC059021 TaxID=3346704 RepID=UPI00366F9882
MVTALLEHLRGRRARSVTLLSGTEDNAWNRRSREAYLAWCELRGCTPRTGKLGEGLDRDDAAAVLLPLLADPERPDALIVASSNFAALAAEIAAAQGLRVPDDLMIASLTDTEHTRSASPPITAMDLSHERLAEHAVELMLARLAGTEAVCTRPDQCRPRSTTSRNRALGEVADVVPSRG